MPGNCFSFAVIVTCEVDHFGVLDQCFEIFDHLFFVGSNLIGRFEAIFDVDGLVAFGEIPHVAVAGSNLKVLSQVTFNGFCFGGGFYDDKIFRHKNIGLGKRCPK